MCVNYVSRLEQRAKESIVVIYQRGVCHVGKRPQRYSFCLFFFFYLFLNSFRLFAFALIHCLLSSLVLSGLTMPLGLPVLTFLPSLIIACLSCVIVLFTFDYFCQNQIIFWFNYRFSL